MLRHPRLSIRVAVACTAVVLSIGIAPVADALAAPSGRGPGARPMSTVPPVDTTNPFLPENANLGDCLSSLPRPDCGSAARGGFAQWSVLVVLVAGLAFIGWRVVRGARRNAAAAAHLAPGTAARAPSSTRSDTTSDPGPDTTA